MFVGLFDSSMGELVSFLGLVHCTMRLSTQLELSKMFKSKGLDFGNFSSKSDNSSFDW